jgi:tetratricopeptide (TPR) repeat protein
MKTVRSFQFLAAALAAFHFAACSGVQVTHVAPGKSAAAAIAERNAAKQAPGDVPAPGNMPVVATTRGELPPGALPPLPSGAVQIPNGTAASEGVAEAYSRGTFAMQAGQNAEAIAALEQAVKLDPDFTDAWGKLAILYQKAGNSAKATAAFKRAKRLGDPNGGTVSRDAVGGLQLQ